MKEINLVTVGPLKDKNLQIVESTYLKQTKNPKIKIYETRAFGEDVNAEAESVIKKVDELSKNSKHHLILLTEHGKLMNTTEFSVWLTKLIELKSRKIFFVIGGSAGLGELLYKRADEKISLSPLTFPHRVARLLIIEQIYRAQTIRSGHPYSK